MQVLQEAYGFKGERVWMAASGFGGGIGRLQSVCGAVTGGVMALGLREGQSVESPRADPKRISTAVRPKVKEFVERFRAEFGAIDCGALLPFDFKQPGGYEAFQASGIKHQTCQRYKDFAVRLLAEEKGV